MKTCSVLGCDRPVYGKGFCKAHHQQVRVHGRIVSANIRRRGNDYEIRQDHAELILRDIAGNETARAMVDLDDLCRARQYTWSLHSNGYVRCMHKGRTTYLHRVLLRLMSGGQEVDHIDRDKLNNRKSNLRCCPHWVNACNKAHTVQPTRLKRNLRKPYRAQLVRNGRVIRLGYFCSEEEARQALDEARLAIDTSWSAN